MWLTVIHISHSEINFIMKELMKVITSNKRVNKNTIYNENSVGLNRANLCIIHNCINWENYDFK